jgi:hypothetical protein
MASILKVDTIQDQSGNNIINENADTITIGASGDTITVPTGATLTVPNGKITGQNYPAFEATISATQTLTDNTTQDVALDTENLDTDGSFNTSTYIFQPTVAGKYFVYAQARFNHGGDDLGLVQISATDENDVNIVSSASEELAANTAESRMLNFSKIVDMNGSTNTLKMTTYVEQLGVGAITLRTISTLFGAYRIGA